MRGEIFAALGVKGRSQSCNEPECVVCAQKVFNYSDTQRKAAIEFAHKMLDRAGEKPIPEQLSR